MFYTVKNMQQAWNKVNEIFPTDYEKDVKSSEHAGYPVYRSTAEGHYYDYICDLNDRLEVNLSTGESINVWVKPEKVAEESNDESCIMVEVATEKTCEVRTFEYSEFINTARFFWSSGEEHTYVEQELSEMSEVLKKMNKHGMAMEIIYGGLVIKVVFYRWKQYDRFMHSVKK